MYNSISLPRDSARGLADRLIALRKQRGWSQMEMARRSGVSLGSLKRFEQRAKISLENLLKLAAVLFRLNDLEAVFAYDADLEAVKKRFDEI